MSGAGIASIGLLVTLARFVHIITMQDRIGSVLTGKGRKSNGVYNNVAGRRRHRADALRPDRRPRGAEENREGGRKV